MYTKPIKFDSHECKSNIKQNWLKINDEHLNFVSSRNDLFQVIKNLYQFDQNLVEQQIQDWIDNQIYIDGHIYQTNLKSFN